MWSCGESGPRTFDRKIIVSLKMPDDPSEHPRNLFRMRSEPGQCSSEYQKKCRNDPERHQSDENHPVNGKFYIVCSCPSVMSMWCDDPFRRRKRRQVHSLILSSQFDFLLVFYKFRRVRRSQDGNRQPDDHDGKNGERPLRDGRIELRYAKIHFFVWREVNPISPDLRRFYCIVRRFFGSIVLGLVLLFVLVLVFLALLFARVFLLLVSKPNLNLNFIERILSFLHHVSFSKPTYYFRFKYQSGSSNVLVMSDTLYRACRVRAAYELQTDWRSRQGGIAWSQDVSMLPGTHDARKKSLFRSHSELAPFPLTRPNDRNKISPGTWRWSFAGIDATDEGPREFSIYNDSPSPITVAVRYGLGHLQTGKKGVARPLRGPWTGWANSTETFSDGGEPYGSRPSAFLYTTEEVGPYDRKKFVCSWESFITDASKIPSGLQVIRRNRCDIAVEATGKDPYHVGCDAGRDTDDVGSCRNECDVRFSLDDERSACKSMCDMWTADPPDVIDRRTNLNFHVNDVHLQASCTTGKDGHRGESVCRESISSFGESWQFSRMSDSHVRCGSSRDHSHIDDLALDPQGSDWPNQEVGARDQICTLTPNAGHDDSFKPACCAMAFDAESYVVRPGHWMPRNGLTGRKHPSFASEKNSKAAQNTLSASLASFMCAPNWTPDNTEQCDESMKRFCLEVANECPFGVDGRTPMRECGRYNHAACRTWREKNEDSYLDALHSSYRSMHRRLEDEYVSACSRLSGTAWIRELDGQSWFMNDYAEISRMTRIECDSVMETFCKRNAEMSVCACVKSGASGTRACIDNTEAYRRTTGEDSVSRSASESLYSQ